MSDETLANLVDNILDQHDSDFDGYLDWYEYNMMLRSAQGDQTDEVLEEEEEEYEPNEPNEEYREYKESKKRRKRKSRKH